ncbi:MAG TPA: diguanylate cyclase [Candidatus Limnocylindrales bacterium]|nr:diguanylate cyclase [Candidatus Limnocylindrales bacterium]
MVHLLLIDPNKFFIEAYQKLLITKGYICSFIEDKNVLQEQLAKPADLILIDLDGKGLEKLSLVRQIHPHVPVLAVSTQLSFELVQNLLKLNIQDLLPKSVKPEKLFTRIEYHLQNSPSFSPEKPNLLVELEKKIHELSTFNELARTLTSTLQLKEVLQIIMDKIKDLVKSQALSLLLIDEKTKELVFSATETAEADKLEGIRLKWGQGIAGWVAKTMQPILVEDVYKDTRFFQDIDKMQGFKTRSIMCAPLLYRNELVGVIEVVNKYGGGNFSHEELQILVELSSRFSEKHGQALRYQNLTPETDKILRNLIAEVRNFIKAEALSILLLDEEKKELVFSASETLRGGTVEGLRLKLGQGIAGWVASTKEPLFVEDVKKDPRFFKEVDKISNFESKSIICAPLISKNKLLGVVEIINKADGTSFTEKDFQLVLTLADHAAIAIENATLYRQVELAAITDDLTKLYNSRYLHRFLIQELQRSKREGFKTSILLLDLDNFKQVNDTYGHLVGSQTLVEVGQIMKSKVREKDVVGRFGGDEFIIILPETGSEQAVAIAERIRQAIEDLKVLRDFDVDISALSVSIGVATYPDHGLEEEELIQKADQAMYHVKQHFKNGVKLAS